MKVYKTTISYELETLTDAALSQEALDRIRYNIQANLNHYNMLNSNGRLVVCSQEIEV